MNFRLFLLVAVYRFWRYLALQPSVGSTGSQRAAH